LLTHALKRRHLHDKSKMVAQPAKKPIAIVLRIEIRVFYFSLVALLHRIPFDQTLLARSIHSEFFGRKMNRLR
jgi:hypothetical protein